MAGVTWPYPRSDSSETIEQLNGLLNAERSRRRDGIRLLEAAVARLDGPPVGDLEDEPVSRERRDERSVRSGSRPDPVPFVALPKRTTRGGDYGPKVRAKLTAEALAKRGWW